MNDFTEGQEVISVETGTVALITKAEIDQQISTAKKYPRSIKRFVDEATAMVTLNESIAQQCIYALPRDGKTIEGASARFGEIVASAWGNCRAGARVVNEGTEFITAQGVFHDLERNVAITYEVQRRIVDKNGRKFKPDMIGVTANAACSIALRNSILKGVPKAFWEPMYQKARAVVAGDIKTLANKRAEAIKQFTIFGVTEPMILEKLGRPGVADITPDDLVTLFGLLTAIRDGDTTPEQAFGEGQTKTGSSGEQKALPPVPENELKNYAKAIAGGKKTPAGIIAMASGKYTLTEAQRKKIEAMETDDPRPGPEAMTYAQVSVALNTAGDLDTLDMKADLINRVADTVQRDELSAIYHGLRAKLEG